MTDTFQQVQVTALASAQCSIGYAPTVVDRKVLKVEAHLFNFDQDIYGEQIKIRLQRFIRPEKKFQSIDDLLEQIKADIDSIKNK